MGAGRDDAHPAAHGTQRQPLLRPGGHVGHVVAGVDFDEAAVARLAGRGGQRLEGLARAHLQHRPGVGRPGQQAGGGHQGAAVHQARRIFALNSSAMPTSRGPGSSSNASPAARLPSRFTAR